MRYAQMIDQRKRERRLMLRRALFVGLAILLAYAAASFDDCTGKDLAELTDSQKAEIVSRWQNP